MGFNIMDFCLLIHALTLACSREEPKGQQEAANARAAEVKLFTWTRHTNTI